MRHDPERGRAEQDSRSKSGQRRYLGTISHATRGETAMTQPEAIK